MYEDPIISRYIELLQTGCPEIKAWYQGEPTKLAGVDLPCAMLSKRETRIQQLSNAEDQHQIGMSLTVIVDVRSDLSTDESSGEIVKGVSSLYRIIEGRDPDTFKLTADSVLGVLRGNLVVDAAKNLRTDLGTVTRAEYGLTLNDREKEEWRIEASVDFVVSYSQVR